jgi:hypothetical protein
VSNETKLIALLKAVLDSPTLSEQSNAVVVSGKEVRRIADELTVHRETGFNADVERVGKPYRDLPRCDFCDNQIEPEWAFCPFCSRVADFEKASESAHQGTDLSGVCYGKSGEAMTNVRLSTRIVSVRFKNYPTGVPGVDTPGAVAVADDGGEWRLSEREIAAALNAVVGRVGKP